MGGERAGPAAVESVIRRGPGRVAGRRTVIRGMGRGDAVPPARGGRLAREGAA